ncbi:MAG: hypothetical protein JWM68_600 [Verrucomicrobiales bacterium]|nr:hypothetical protein [Verrucomicrobiales bacterium]
MEGLRGLAVLFVFLVHYHALFSGGIAEGSLTYHVSRCLSSIGHTGVDLFFVLSGYLIYGAVVSKPTNYPKFMKRRIQRIYPTFLCVFGIYLLISLVMPAENKIPKGLSQGAIYLAQNLFLLPGMFDIVPFITVAWSLSYELFFYLFIPVVVAVLSMRRWPGFRRAIFFITGTAVLTVYCWITVFPHLRLIMFVAGILLYETIQSLKLANRLSRQTELFLLFAIVGVFVINHFLSNLSLLHIYEEGGTGKYWRIVRQLLLFITFFTLTWACFTSRGLFKTLFSFTPLRWLGNMSYSYYLVHGLALKGVLIVLRKAAFFGNSTVMFWMLLPIAMVVTLIISTLLFVLVEKRFSLVNPSREKTLSPAASVPVHSSPV